MNSPSSSPAPVPWPPLIGFAHAPWFVRVRDIVLTILAWALLLHLVYSGLYIFIDYLFIYPKLTLTNPYSWRDVRLLGKFNYFGLVAFAAMLWLAMWSLINRQRLRAVKRMPSPPPLPVAEHAASFQLAPEVVEHWQEMKISVVQFDAQHRIVAVLPPEANSPAIPHPTPNPAEPEPGPSTSVDTGA
jgi:poly-beta-1,6-N-acetyl-D-glucosamine biosynthesis protein PgaD